MKFDQIIHKAIGEDIVDYGFLFGNENIVFIKAGCGGSMSGYCDKYLKMAHKVHERLGATVICSSNPAPSLEMDRKAIRWCAKQLNQTDFSLYFVGTSDGAYQCMSLAKSKLTKKLLCINPSFVPSQDPKSKLILLSTVEKIFVYGTNDEEGYTVIPKLKDACIPNFEIKMVNGADHEFTGMIDEFISLIDLI